jgi:DNA-binding transcriptional regulator PaaX
MRVNGVEIPQEVIDRCVKRMKNGEPFQAAHIESLSHHPEGYRLTDRLLQRERKAGNIIYRSGMWHWVGPR